ncbi:hypothetical protein FA95DRAFT_1659078 [Auriscalpium vulgare]|uniref:Uncharacterized protein n=1 Tax=Auriscalpium vulgare TaxID=40419 RepID=A0ACB8RVK5_9AGAM|nr:hypothetical protein FA95DRAFT_1659078 [Auriscalpium vulgare]
MANNMSEPIITTHEKFFDSLKDRGELKRPCGRCHAAPPREKPFAHCQKCVETHYCRCVQRAHWPEHKALCKERVAANTRRAAQKQAALTEGRAYVDPRVLQNWYRSNSSIVQHIAYNVLRIHDGPARALLKTHLALITLRADGAGVRFEDAVEAPWARLVDLGAEAQMPANPGSRTAEAIAREYMTLVFLDLESGATLLEYHQAPPPREKRDELWKVRAVAKLTGALKGGEGEN